MTRIATTWGIGGPEFLWLYAGLCAAVAAVILRIRRDGLGPRARSRDPLPELDVYKIAMLSGGPQLAITTAATRLRRDGLVRGGDQPHTHCVAGAIGAQADPLERAVHDAVQREPGITTRELRTELADSEPIGWLRSDLTAVDLLMGEDTARVLRRLWWCGALLVALGVARTFAGLDSGAVDGYLVAIVLAVATGTFWLASTPTHATERGRAIVRGLREARVDLGRAPSAQDSVMAVALFGGAALWTADPSIAAALDVPREDDAGWRRQQRYACSMGGGGCAGGLPGSGDGGGSWGGGGGCGGGGCGGGGT